MASNNVMGRGFGERAANLKYIVIALRAQKMSQLAANVD